MVKQHSWAGLLCSAVHFNAGISSGQLSLSPCLRAFYFRAQKSAAVAAVAAAICRSAAMQPVPRVLASGR